MVNRDEKIRASGLFRALVEAPDPTIEIDGARFQFQFFQRSKRFRGQIPIEVEFLDTTRADSAVGIEGMPDIDGDFKARRGLDTYGKKRGKTKKPPSLRPEKRFARADKVQHVSIHALT
jgi:hypothetical protein